jgi:hypothetical protein
MSDKCIICGESITGHGNNPYPLCKLFCKEGASSCDNCTRSSCNCCNHLVIDSRDSQIESFINSVAVKIKK